MIRPSVLATREIEIRKVEPLKSPTDLIIEKQNELLSQLIKLVGENQSPVASQQVVTKPVEENNQFLIPEVEQAVIANPNPEIMITAKKCAGSLKRWGNWETYDPSDEACETAFSKDPQRFLEAAKLSHQMPFTEHVAMANFFYHALRLNREDALVFAEVYKDGKDVGRCPVIAARRWFDARRGKRRQALGHIENRLGNAFIQFRGTESREVSRISSAQNRYGRKFCWL